MCQSGDVDQQEDVVVVDGDDKAASGWRKQSRQHLARAGGLAKESDDVERAGCD